jgi:YD repeat-containing protein
VEGTMRWDGQRSRVGFGVNDGRMVWMEGPTGGRTVFTYRDGGYLLERVRSSRGVVTMFEWGDIRETNIVCVERVVTVDTNTGDTVGVRVLDLNPFDRVGGHTFVGPDNEGPGVVFDRGGDYVYQSTLSDHDTQWGGEGATVLFEWNSAHMLVGEHTTVSTPGGGQETRSRTFTYPGTQAGVTSPGALLPANHMKPDMTTVTYTNTVGGSRSVVELTRFDECGRLVERVSGNGSTMRRMYDSGRVEGLRLPLGLLREEHTFPTTGVGPSSRTVYGLAEDRRSVANTTVYVAEADGVEVAKQTVDTVVEPDGDHKGEVREHTIRYLDTNPGTGTGLDGGGHSVGGPRSVTTRYDRNVDYSTGIRTITVSVGFGSGAQRVTSRVEGLGGGLVVKDVDELGLETVYGYDRVGRRVSVVDPAGRVTLTEYGADHMSVTTPDGHQVTEYTDGLGRVVETVDNVRNSEEAEEGARVVSRVRYVRHGREKVVTDTGGRNITIKMDMFGRETHKTLSNGMTHISDYDDANQTSRTGLVPAGGTSLGNAEHVITQTNNTGERTTRIEHEYADTTITPVTVMERDILGRTTNTTSKDIHTATQFDVDGSPAIQVHTPTNPTEYGGVGVKVERTHNLRGVSTYKNMVTGDGDTQPGMTRVLDEEGLVVSQTNQVGETTMFTYTLDGLTQTMTTPEGSTVFNEYDPHTRTLTTTTTRTSNGEMSESKTFEYDRSTDRVTGVYYTGERDKTLIRYGYNFLGNRTSITYPDGTKLDNRYDDTGLLTTKTDSIGALTTYEYYSDGTPQTVQQTFNGVVLGYIKYVYDEYGRIRELVRGNGVTTQYSFTATGRVTTETTRDSTGTILVDSTYEYDSHGNTSQARTAYHESPYRGVETVVYEYDVFDRLIRSHRTNSENVSVTVYDVNVAGDVIGEHTQVTTREGTTRDDMDSTTSTQFGINILGQAETVTTNNVSVPQMFDQAGNVTGDHTVAVTPFGGHLVREDVHYEKQTSGVYS